MARQRSVFPRNDNLVFIRGLINEADPKDVAGNPKWINDATGTWDIRTAEYPGGVVIASGNVVVLGSGGSYRCELANSIAISAASGYWFHAVLTAIIVDQGTFVADFSDSFEAIARTGRTSVT